MNNFTNKLYIKTEQDDAYRQWLEQHSLPDLEICTSPEVANLILAAPPLIANQLNEFPQLEWLQSTYAGVNALVQPHLRQDYQLTNVKGIFGQSMAEYVLGYTIQHYRHFPLYTHQQQQKVWQPHQYPSLAAKNMLILGTGSIGCYLAQSAKQFGLNTLGVNRTGIPAKGGAFTQTYHINELPLALKQADIVVNTLPSTEATQNILNQESLSHCQRVLLFNVGRGDAVDERGLLIAIRNHWVEHAYLDVFRQEPLDAQHPFWSVKQITLTPHIAALSFPEQVVDIFAHNYQLWRDGFTLEHLVDFDKGY